MSNRIICDICLQTIESNWYAGSPIIEHMIKPPRIGSKYKFKKNDGCGWTKMDICDECMRNIAESSRKERAEKK